MVALPPDSLDSQFCEAVSAIDAGDVTTLEQLRTPLGWAEHGKHSRSPLTFARTGLHRHASRVPRTE
jgi:hypothetical protein